MGLSLKYFRISSLTDAAQIGDLIMFESLLNKSYLGLDCILNLVMGSISRQRAFQMRQSCTNQTQFEYDGKHIDKRHSKLLIQIEIIAEILSIIF